MSYRYSRMLRRLDQLVIGARPDKLKAQTEIPAARMPAPLTDKERARLSALETKRMYHGPLTPLEAWEREQLRARRGQ
jgi:hypothetical protein